MIPGSQASLPRAGLRHVKSAVAALASIGVLVVLSTSGGAAPPRGAPPGATHPLTFFDDRAFARAMAKVEASSPQPMPSVRVVIIPHHWVGGNLILGGLRDLAASGDFRRVILIGPNHTSAGGAPVTTSDLPWETPFGLIQPDAETAAAIARDGVAAITPDVLTYEHSIAGIVPAVARYLPRARVLPLAIGPGITPTEARRLSSALAGLVDERTVLVAAVDFSHYLRADEARARDAETVAALESLDSGRILSFGNEHVDSPAAIAVVMDVARLLGAARFELRGDTNSAEIDGTSFGSVTSYITGYYH